MDTKKDEKIKDTKKSGCGCCCDHDDMKDLAMAKIKTGYEEVEKIVKESKKRFDKADDKTKKKFLAGIAGAAAVLGGIIGVTSAIKKHNKNKDK